MIAKAIYRPLHNDPVLHNDPFDRILIAEAIFEGITPLTPDKKVAPGPIGKL